MRSLYGQRHVRMHVRARGALFSCVSLESEK
jgi:hypothetical protein